MISRRMFLGSTLGAISTGGIIKLPKYNADLIGGNYGPGDIQYYRFELDIIELNNIGGELHVANFPLCDKLIVGYKHKDFAVTETYSVFNWQVRGLSFSIDEFLKIEWSGEIGSAYRKYKNYKFLLSGFEME